MPLTLRELNREIRSIEYSVTPVLNTWFVFADTTRPCKILAVWICQTNDEVQSQNVEWRILFKSSGITYPQDIGATSITSGTLWHGLLKINFDGSYLSPSTWISQTDGDLWSSLMNVPEARAGITASIRISNALGTHPLLYATMVINEAP